MSLPLLLGSLTLGHCSPALLASGPGTRQPRPTPIAQNPLKWPNPKSAYAAFLHLSRSNHNKVAHISPSLLLLPDWPWHFPCGAPWGTSRPFLLGAARNKLSFQWQLSSDLLASPYLNHQKACILKHSLPWFSQSFKPSIAGGAFFSEKRRGKKMYKPEAAVLCSSGKWGRAGSPTVNAFSDLFYVNSALPTISIGRAGPPAQDCGVLSQGNLYLTSYNSGSSSLTSLVFICAPAGLKSSPGELWVPRQAERYPPVGN